MIFVTVGAQMPFDRLVRAVDEWAGSRRRSDIFAQIGTTTWRPSHIRWVQWLAPVEFRRRFQAASLVVAHAGMGSIITAMDLGKSILVLPRRGDLGETRNDHQIATAQRFCEMGLVTAAFDEGELVVRLDELCARSADNGAGDVTCPHYEGGCPLRSPDACAGYAKGRSCPQLHSALRRFIEGTADEPV